LRGGSDEFETADEDADGVGRSGMDVERKNGIDEGARNDVDEAGTFFEPGGFPGFDHGVGFVREETLRDEETFENRGEGIEGAVERGLRERGLIA